MRRILTDRSVVIASASPKIPTHKRKEPTSPSAATPSAVAVTTAVTNKASEAVSTTIARPDEPRTQSYFNIAARTSYRPGACPCGHDSVTFRGVDAGTVPYTGPR
jgi:hypothetical protein